MVTILVILGVLLFVYVFYGAINLINIYKFFLSLLPFAGLVFLGWWAWTFWVHYIQQDFISGIEWVVLEIVPPREVLRSPQSMELFISNALYHFSYKGGKEEYWQGAVWFWFSLEIASIDGQVHFYIRAPSRTKTLIETQMYAQFPQAQVKVVEDYTLAVPEISEKSEWNGWGCEFWTTKPNAYPIRTYVDYGLDQDPKEEYKVDPISPVIELFGALGKGEQAWLQIVVTPSKQKFKVPGSLFKTQDWQQDAEKTLLDLLKPYTRVQSGLDGGTAKEIRPPKYMDDIVAGASRKMQKLGFDTGIRLMYVAKKSIFPVGRRSNHSRNIRLIFRQYESPFLNGFIRKNSSQGDFYGGIFTSSKETVTLLAHRMLTEYRERSFFHEAMRKKLFNKETMPWPVSPMIFPAYPHNKIFVLNTEELATLWHFPGQILKVPTLERIESKEASPPTNLPT